MMKYTHFLGLIALTLGLLSSCNSSSNRWNNSNLPPRIQAELELHSLQKQVHQEASKTLTTQTTSGPAELALARHLTASGAIFYGAYWCPHCQKQVDLFGQEALAILERVECAQDGLSRQPERCQAAGIEGFPTWVIKGQKYAGSQTLEQLANASEYEGDRNFRKPEVTPQ